MKKNYFLFLVLLMFVPAICISQTSVAKAPMPTQQNTIIVNKIIDVTNYKTYFVDYCLTKINETANKEKWNEQKTVQITETINFKNFRDAVYNMFAFYNEVELETLLKEYQKNTAYQTTNAMTTNKVLLNNLDIYAKDVVEGKYLAK
jgi:cytochrome c biogenesis protein ResB